MTSCSQLKLWSVVSLFICYIREIEYLSIVLLLEQIDVYVLDLNLFFFFLIKRPTK